MTPERVEELAIQLAGFIKGYEGFLEHAAGSVILFVGCWMLVAVIEIMGE
jgi:hypothetical protein